MKRFCFAAALMLALAGCQQSNTPNEAAQPAAPSPPPATQNAPAPANPPASSSAATQPAAVAKPGEAAQTQPSSATAPAAVTQKPAAPVARKPVAPAAPATPAKQVATAGDAAKGKLIARKCAACHDFTAKKKVGPGWGKGDTGNGMQPGIFGREAGTSPGFKYKFTEYIKPGKAWHWDAAHIRAWDCDSAEAIRKFTGDPNAKTRMPPQHVCDRAEQDDIIAFMKTL